MANFALNTTDPYGEVISSLNYVIANLGSVAGIDTGNVLIANVTTGQITSNGSVVSYLYQYMDVQYANSSTGGSGFSSNSFNKSYFGLRNTANATPISFNPTDYIWYQVSGGFGTTKSLFYQTIGGRQVAFFAGNSAPASSFIPVPDMPTANSTPLDLDTITSAQNNQIVNVNAYYQANTTPATPSGGTYNFTTFVLTPPSGWSANIPGFVANTSIYVSQAAFVGNTNATSAPPATAWTVPAVYSEQFQGNTGPAGQRGFVPMGFVITSSDPTFYSNANLTTAFSSSRTSSSPPIGLGFAPIQYDTAQFAYQDLFTGNTTTVVKQYDGAGWTTVVGNVISGGLFVPGSINANTLNANQVYALTIASTNANVGNVASNGFWLQSSTGDARFGGNVSIGNNLTIGQNAQIGANLNVGTNAVIGNNLSVGTNATIGNNLSVGTNLTVGTNAAIGNSLTIGTNATIGNNAVIGGNLSVTGLITQGALANAVVTTATLADGTVTGVKIAAGTITGNLIQANTITGNNIQAGSIYGNSIVANSFTANTINGNAIIAGSLTLTGNINSAGSVVGDPTAPGYWLEYNNGSARFGGNVNIGNNLTVGNLITASALNANTVSTTVLTLNSASQTIFAADDPAVNQILFVNGPTNDPTSSNFLWPDNTRGFGVGGGATINPTTTGSVNGSRIQVQYNAYVTSVVDNDPNNLIELWKNTPSSYYATSYRSISFDDIFQTTAGASVVQFYVAGDNGAVGNLYCYSQNPGTRSNTFSQIGGFTNRRAANGAPYLQSVSQNLYTTTQFQGQGIPQVYGAEGAFWTNYAPAYYYQTPPPTTFNIYGSKFVTVYAVNTVTPSQVNVNWPGLVVGNGGQIFRTHSFFANATIADANTLESSTTFADLNGIASDFAEAYEYYAASPLVNYVVVGTGGVLLYNSRGYNTTYTGPPGGIPSTVGQTISSTGWAQAVTNTTQNLNGVASNAEYLNAGVVPPSNPTTRATRWVAVGDAGTILTSNNAGGPWTLRTSGTTQNLHAVACGNGGNWLAVGDAGTMLYSTDNGQTWASISNPADGSGAYGVRNLTAVAGAVKATSGSQVQNIWAVGGQEIVMHSNTSLPSQGWIIDYAAGASYNNQLTRLMYNGSWANVANTSVPPNYQRITNQQVVSGTVVDTNYTAGVPVTYYLVLGNLAGNTIYTGGPSLTVTEYKR